MLNMNQENGENDNDDSIKLERTTKKNVDDSDYNVVGARKHNTRRIMAQVLACIINNLLNLEYGAGISLPVIVIAGLTGTDDIIRPTASDLSWFGSISYISYGVACLSTGIIMDNFGRKISMMIVNVPRLIAWVFIWKAQDMSILLVGNLFIGLGSGLLNAPFTTFMGEICEPSIRGVLLSLSGIFTNFGIILLLMLGTFLPWRTAAAVCLTMPCLSIVLLSLMPESPVWLISKGRNEDALRALCWLRGWVKPSEVKEEFNELIRYTKNNMKCQECETIKDDSLFSETLNNCVHSKKSRYERFKSIAKEMKKRESRRPLILSCVFMVLSNMTGMLAYYPNMANTYKAFRISVNYHWASVGTGVTSLLGMVLCLVIVKFVGKRKLTLSCMFLSSVTALLIGVYAYHNIPHNIRTYDVINDDHVEKSIYPLIVFLLFFLVNNAGILYICWMYAAEIFPYKTRGYCSGVVSFVCSVSSFITIKTQLYIEDSFNIFGAFFFYSAFTFIGFVYLYFCLLETENRTLEEIQSDFAPKKTRIFADDFIARKLKDMCK